MPASPPIRNTSATEAHRDEGIEPGRDDDAAEDVAAQLIGAEPVRRRRRLQRRGGVAGQRIVGHDVGAEDRGEQDDDQQAEGKGGDAVLAEHIAGVFEDRGQAPRYARDRRVQRQAQNSTHASNLTLPAGTRGSITP